MQSDLDDNNREPVDIVLDVLQPVRTVPLVTSKVEALSQSLILQEPANDQEDHQSKHIQVENKKLEKTPCQYLIIYRAYFVIVKDSEDVCLGPRKAHEVADDFHNYKPLVDVVAVGPFLLIAVFVCLFVELDHAGCQL